MNIQTGIDVLAALIRDQIALIIGPIRQEILSGHSDLRKHRMIKQTLSYFANTSILDADYEQATELSNQCRIKGVQGSRIDFLICAAASRIGTPIFTTDKNFEYYQKNNSHQTFKAEG